MVLKYSKAGRYKCYSEVLPEIYNKLPKDYITLREFLDLMGEPGKLILSLLLASPFLIPISIPGTGVIAGLIIFSLSISLIFNRNLIPDRFMKIRISNEHLIKALNITSRVFSFLERFIKPRLLVMTSSRLTYLNKLFLLTSTLLFMFPLPVPLTDTLPALCVFLLAAGILERDGYLILAGYSVVILNILYFTSIVLLGLLGISYFGINLDIIGGI
ncbi:MAG: exopolysaccharide biosynthesis protein [Methanobacterium sp.]